MALCVACILGASSLTIANKSQTYPRQGTTLPPGWIINCVIKRGRHMRPPRLPIYGLLCVFDEYVLYIGFSPWYVPSLVTHCLGLVQLSVHDDVIKCKYFPRYGPFVRGIHRSPVNSPHKGQWRGALCFLWSVPEKTRWVNNREAGDLRRHRAHYDVFVMSSCIHVICLPINLSQTSLIHGPFTVLRHWGRDKFLHNGPINNIPALVQIMAWRRPGDKPLPEPMLVSSLTHICVTRPQCVKLV